MPCIPAAGLIDTPPVSNVIDLPITRRGLGIGDWGLGEAAGLCSRTIIRGGVALPAPTAVMPPMPSRFISCSSNTRTTSPTSAAISAAALASVGGLMSLLGRVAIVRAKFCPAAITAARSTSAATSWAVTIVSVTPPLGSASSLAWADPLYSRKSNRASRNPVATAAASAGSRTATAFNLCFFAARAIAPPALRYASALTLARSPRPTTTTRCPVDSTQWTTVSPALPVTSPALVSPATTASNGPAAGPVVGSPLTARTTTASAAAGTSPVTATVASTLVGTAIVVCSFGLAGEYTHRWHGRPARGCRRSPGGARDRGRVRPSGTACLVAVDAPLGPTPMEYHRPA